MRLLKDLLDLKELECNVEKGYVLVRHHPSLPYRILNYTKQAAEDCAWNNVTETCRGLIVDDNDVVIARPFRKFYNYSEIVAKGEESIIPDEKFTIYDKLDGCLGILFVTPDGKLDIATRGSMTSSQSEWAAEFLNKSLTADEIRELRDMICVDSDGVWMQNKTLCFEIIYNGERHVVDYGGREFLTLLAVIDNETGKDLSLDPFKKFFNTPDTFDCDWSNVRTKFPRSNAEGFVIKFESGFRMKIKYDEFLNAQRIIHGLTFRRIFDAVKNGKLSEIIPHLSRLEEETVLYIKEQMREIIDTYFDTEFDALLEYKDFETDKEAAEYFKTRKEPSVLFCVRKNQDYSNIIWKRTKEKLKEKKTFFDDYGE